MIDDATLDLKCVQGLNSDVMMMQEDFSFSRHGPFGPEISAVPYSDNDLAIHTQASPRDERTVSLINIPCDFEAVITVRGTVFISTDK
jgi:hypothetical protein